MRENIAMRITIGLGLMFLVSCVHALAAGNVTQGQTPVQLGTSDIWVIQFDWTGDASDGSVPAITAQELTPISGYQPVGVQFVPGTPEPSDGYSVAIYSGLIGTTRRGADLLAGAGISLSATSPGYGAIAATATPLVGTITMQVSGNSVASAKGTVQVFFQKTGVYIGKRATTSSGGGSSDDSGQAVAIVDQITPTGTEDGANVTFTIADAPVTGSVYLWRNGILMKNGEDYFITTRTLTLASAPSSDDFLLVSYRK